MHWRDKTNIKSAFPRGGFYPMMWEVIGLSEVASDSCLQLIKAFCPCIFKWSRGPAGNFGGERGNHEGLTPVWSNNWQGQQAWSSSAAQLDTYSPYTVSLDHLASLWWSWLSCAGAGLVPCFYILLLVHRSGVIKAILRDAWPAVAIDFEGCFSPFDLTSQERQDWILVLPTINEYKKLPKTVNLLME